MRGICGNPNKKKKRQAYEPTKHRVAYNSNIKKKKGHKYTWKDITVVKKNQENKKHKRKQKKKQLK